jgi:acetyl-CoA synthetase
MVVPSHLSFPSGASDGTLPCEAIADQAGRLQRSRLTYRELHAEVCRMANVLKDMGVMKGDRVTLYLPMVPAAAVAMLACARIGAIHSVVFGGFSPDSLAGRIEDCGSRVVITADEGVRGGKRIPLKANVDAALEKVGVDKVLLIAHTGAEVPVIAGRDVRYEQAKSKVRTHRPGRAPREATRTRKALKPLRLQCCA